MFISPVCSPLYNCHILNYLSLHSVCSLFYLSAFSLMTSTVAVTNQQRLSFCMKIRTRDEHILISFVFKNDIEAQSIYFVITFDYPELWYATFQKRKTDNYWHRRKTCLLSVLKYRDKERRISFLLCQDDTYKSYL